MDELTREKEQGFDFDYLMDSVTQAAELGDKYKTPGFGLASQLFSSLAKEMIDRLGLEQAEPIIKEAVEAFGKERGRRIAQRVQAEGRPLTFKNWLIYGDIDSSSNFNPQPSIEDGDLLVQAHNCTFYNAAKEWGLEKYANLYCKYVDYAILEGYNPDITLTLEERQASGRDYCLFRYNMKRKS